MNDQAYQIFLEHGSHPLSYTTLQEGMDYFFSDCGYIAFRKSGFTKTPFVLGDPVCAPESIDSIVKKFVHTHPDSCFLQIMHPATAIALQNKGFYVNEFGIETLLDLETYTLNGRKKQIIRTSRNKCRQRGVYVLESSIEDIGRETVDAISKSWIARKAVNEKEMGFLARPIAEDEDINGSRQFYAVRDTDSGRDVLGFVYFDPMFKNGRTIGYAADILRERQSRSSGMLDFVITEAMDQFRKEGIDCLSLGFSPYAGIGKSRYRQSPFTQWFFSFAFQNMRHLYDSQSLAFHKSRFRGREEKVYFASRRKYPLVNIVQMYQLCGIPIIRKSFQQKNAGKNINALAKALRELKENFFFVDDEHVSSAVRAAVAAADEIAGMITRH